MCLLHYQLKTHHQLPHLRFFAHAPRDRTVHSQDHELGRGSARRERPAATVVAPAAATTVVAAAATVAMMATVITEAAGMAWHLLGWCAYSYHTPTLRTALCDCASAAESAAQGLALRTPQRRQAREAPRDVW